MSVLSVNVYFSGEGSTVFKGRKGVCDLQESRKNHCSTVLFLKAMYVHVTSKCVEIKLESFS